MPLAHGTTSAYTNDRCRCPQCRRAMAVYMRAYRRTHKALGLCRDCAAPAAPQRARCPRHLRETYAAAPV